MSTETVARRGADTAPMPDFDRPDHRRERLGALALVVAPVVMLVGSALHPEESEDGAVALGIIDGASTRWLVAHLLLLLGAVVFIPAGFAISRRLGSQASGAQGAVVVGAAGLVGYFTLEGVGGYQLAGLADRAGAAEYESLAGPATAFGSVGLLLNIGLMVFAVVGWRSGAMPRWVAGSLGVGAALLLVGLVGQVDVVGFGGAVLMTVAMVALAIDDLRR